MGNLGYLNSVYGIPSQRADEKLLVKELDALFKTKFKKVTNASMLRYKPVVILEDQIDRAHLVKWMLFGEMNLLPADARIQLHEIE